MFFEMTNEFALTDSTVKPSLFAMLGFDIALFDTMAPSKSRCKAYNHALLCAISPIGYAKTKSLASI